MQKQIDHKGVITRIDNALIQVTILSVSACAGCHAKGACSMSDMEEKIIDIYDNTESYKIGESVLVSTQESLGWLALLLAYVLPFVLVIISMFSISVFTNNELLIGGVSLLLLVPYYFVLYLLKAKMKNVFSFVIKKNVNI